MEITMIHDLKEANGKTIKENNLEKKHKFSVGSLVEYRCKDSEYDRMRLYVCLQTRDCDGTPLYSLGKKDAHLEANPYLRKLENGFSEENLTLITGPIQS